MELELLDLGVPDLGRPTGNLVPPGPPVDGVVVGMKLGAYARISYAIGDEKEAAVDRQLADDREWAGLHGHEVVAEYVDPKTSAFKNVRREHFERMLADLDAGAIDGVVVWKLDRLVRNHRDFERFEEIRSSRGALLAAVHEPIDTSTEIGMMIVRLLVSFARLESANNSLRTSAAMAEAARLGRLAGGGSRPFGYSRVPAVRNGDGKIVSYPTLAIIPEEAALVRDAARRVLDEGASLTGIAHEWNAAEVPTPAGGKWYTSQVRRLLTSPRIAGLREHRGEVVAEGIWPALVDRETFDRLVARIEGRALKQGRPHKYLLTGVLRCGFCQQPMSGAHHKATSRKAAATEYRCLPVPGPKRCGKISVAAQAVDDLVAEQIAQRFANYQPEPADEAEAELLAQIEADKERLREIGEQYADGAIPIETLKAAVERLEARIGATSRRLARSTMVIPEGADAIREAFGLQVDEGPPPAPRSMAWRRQLVGRVIDSIEVKPAAVRGGPFDGDRIVIEWTKRRPG
ncbi:MAG: recombinase family protein [Actinomycetes bacterium]